MGDPQKLPTEIELILGYTFKNDNLANEALSFDYNRRLAWVGDSALRLIIGLTCYRFDYAPVDFDKVFQGSAGDHNLKRRALAYGIDRFVTKTPGAKPSKGQKQKRYATTVEALLGAIYEDSGGSLKCVARVVDHLGIGVVSFSVALSDSWLATRRQIGR